MEPTRTDTPSFNQPEVKLHFLDYWRIIRIRKAVILAVFLLVSLTTALVTWILPESYASTVRIQVEKESPDVAGIGERDYTMGYDPYWIQTEFEKIQSKTVLYEVIGRLQLGAKWARKYRESGDLREDVTYQILKNMLDVRQARNTSLIEITVVSSEATEAAQIANEIAKVYGEVRRKKRQEITSRGIEVLRTQLDDQDKKLKAKQEELNRMKDQLMISDVEAQGYVTQSTLEPETLRRLDAARLEALREYSRVSTIYETLAQLQKDASKRALLRQAITVAKPDNILSELLQNEALTEQKLANLQVTLGAESPELLSVSRTYEVITNQVNKRVEAFMFGLKATVDAAQSELQSVQMQVELARTNDVAKSIERRPYFQLKRDVEMMQSVRELLFKRITALEIDSQIPKSMIVDIVDKAEPGIRPVKPNKALNISLGIVVGLIIGVGLAFFIEYLDTSVKTIDDVERALQAPVLGVIPQNVGLLHEEGPESPHAEAYRVLRTNVLFSRKDPKLNSMTIVSGGAGEGKSTTLFNLAIVFAQNGQRVLVVDSDLRRPTLHKYLKVSNALGLTNYLLKQNTLEEVIQTSPIPTLDFMPSGKLPSSSLGLLSSVQMKELVRDLKRRYDFVFFDTPPIMGVSDASILASEVDMVLQVIQYRRYPQPMTIRAKQMVEKVGGNLLGIVLNNINMAQDENYYYYSGYYYDYYSYSKGGDEKSAEAKGAKKEGKKDAKPETKVAPAKPADAPEKQKLDLA